jgi:hypothetical protein
MNVVDFLRPKSGQRILFKRRLPRRTGAIIGFSILGSALVLIGLLVLTFNSAFLNGYGKGKLEAMLLQSHPEFTLRLGKLDYSAASDRLSVKSVELSGPKVHISCGQISITGVAWLKLLWGKTETFDVLAKASLRITNIEAQFDSTGYRVRCARLEAAARDSELRFTDTQLMPLVNDEAFFGAHDFRMTRYRGVVPELKVQGFGYQQLFRGTGFRADSIHVSRPSFDILVNRDKPVQVLGKSPPTPNEALAAIAQPVQFNHLVVSNGDLTYRERVIAGRDPGVLTFSPMNLAVEGIANREELSTGIVVRANSRFMNAGELTLLVNLPVGSTNFSLHYSGSLSGMDLIRLNAFLEPAEHLRIKSGNAQWATFDIEVNSGQARGKVRGGYADLKIAFLDKQTGSAKGVENRLGSLLANAFKIRNSNRTESLGEQWEGQVDYARQSQDAFVQYLWFALRTGVLDLISH